MNAFVTYSVTNWIAPFMIRVHNMDTGALGTMLALNVGVAGGIGTFVIGMLSDRLAKRDKRWYTWLPALTMFVSVPAYIAVFSLSDPDRVMLVLVAPMFLMTSSFALILAMIHGMVAPNMRATSSSLLLLIMSTIGLGLGPWLVGLISDHLAPTHGRESIRYALLYVTPAVSLLAGLLFAGAGAHVRDDIANAPR
jgi:predicted MFS family arabinose efflux permease